MQNGYVLGYRPLIVGGAPCCGFRNGKAAGSVHKPAPKPEPTPEPKPEPKPEPAAETKPAEPVVMVVFVFGANQ